MIFRNFVEKRFVTILEFLNGCFSCIAMQQLADKIDEECRLVYEIISSRPGDPYMLQLTHLGPEKNDCHFPNDTFKRILLNENLWNSITISLKFVH